MNLPASATTFLPSFIGLYSEAGIPTNSPLPRIHVYCFSTKSDDNVAEGQKICEEISNQLGFTFRPGSGEAEGEVEIFDVRDVAPKKRMFCASFRLPIDIAYRKKAES
jgi:tRNA (guanine37-N1)-methyltransferase